MSLVPATGAQCPVYAFHLCPSPMELPKVSSFSDGAGFGSDKLKEYMYMFKSFDKDYNNGVFVELSKAMDDAVIKQLEAEAFEQLSKLEITPDELEKPIRELEKLSDSAFEQLKPRTINALSAPDVLKPRFPHKTTP